MHTPVQPSIFRECIPFPQIKDDIIKDIKIVHSVTKLCSYYFSYNVSNGINNAGTLKSTRLKRNKQRDV